VIGRFGDLKWVLGSESTLIIYFLVMELMDRGFEGEFIFTASRSSGPGGQNVNKVSTKVELRFNVMESNVLTGDEKLLIISKLGKRISNEGFLIIQSEANRSQLKNKKESMEKFYQLLFKALTPVKKRKETRPSLASKTKRLDNKKIDSNRKQSRKKIGLDE
jgi:ribosome-associated protein